jgi:hypothetical protein
MPGDKTHMGNKVAKALSPRVSPAATHAVETEAIWGWRKRVRQRREVEEEGETGERRAEREDGKQERKPKKT